MDRLTAIRDTIRRPAFRALFAAAALAAVASFGLHVWAVLRRAKNTSEITRRTMTRPQRPEVWYDGFVPIVDTALRARLGPASDPRYEWLSEPQPFDHLTFRGWAVRFRYHAAGGAPSCCRDGVRVAVMTDTDVECIVAESDLQAVIGETPPEIGDGPAHR